MLILLKHHAEKIKLKKNELIKKLNNFKNVTIKNV